MPRRPKPTQLERDFEQHLIKLGKSQATLYNHRGAVRRFLKHVGDQPLDRVSEKTAREFFAGFKAQQRMKFASTIYQFLNFATSRLPVPVTALGGEMLPAPPAPSKKEIALRQKWGLEKLVQEKEAADDLIAKLARKVIDHYVYFQGRIKGGPDNLDDLYRFADECRELIETNLPLFMGLSAGGRNLGTQIDERAQR